MKNSEDTEDLNLKILTYEKLNLRIYKSEGSESMIVKVPVHIFIAVMPEEDQMAPLNLL